MKKRILASNIGALPILQECPYICWALLCLGFATPCDNTQTSTASTIHWSSSSKARPWCRGLSLCLLDRQEHSKQSPAPLFSLSGWWHFHLKKCIPLPGDDNGRSNIRAWRDWPWSLDVRPRSHQAPRWDPMGLEFLKAESRNWKGGGVTALLGPPPWQCQKVGNFLVSSVVNRFSKESCWQRVSWPVWSQQPGPH